MGDLKEVALVKEAELDVAIPNELANLHRAQSRDVQIAWVELVQMLDVGSREHSTVTDDDDLCEVVGLLELLGDST